MNAERFPGVLAARRDGVTLADNGGGTQVPRETVDAMTAFLAQANAQKGTPFRRKTAVIELADRARVAFGELLGVDAARVGFGANASSLAFAFARTLAHAIRPGDRIVVTDADHAANVVPWTWLSRFGAEIERVAVDARGDLDEHGYMAALAREPVLVALPWASNATGSVFDVARLSAAARDAGALAIVDGVQAAPHLPLDVPSTVSALFFSVYKIYGPHAGAWYADPEFAQRFFTVDEPRLPSEPWQWSMETGTQSYEALAGWLGTMAYLRELGGGDARAAMDRIRSYERELTHHALAAFGERMDRLILYGRGATEDRLPLFAFNVRGATPEDVARHLERYGIEANYGTCYAPRLMRALVPESGCAVRFSFAHYNDTHDVDRCFAALDALVGAAA